MQTLQKPKGAEVKSRKSSTCQPGRVSIKYSDMLLVWSIDKFSPPLSETNAVVVEPEFLATKGGCEIAGEAAMDFLITG